MKRFSIVSAIMLIPAVAIAKGTPHYTYDDRVECAAYYVTLGTIGDFKDIIDIEAGSWGINATHEDEMAHPEHDIAHDGKIFHDVSTRYTGMSRALGSKASAADIAKFRAQHDKKCRVIAKQQCALVAATTDRKCDIFTPEQRLRIYNASDNRH